MDEEIDELNYDCNYNMLLAKSFISNLDTQQGKC